MLLQSPSSYLPLLQKSSLHLPVGRGVFEILPCNIFIKEEKSNILTGREFIILFGVLSRFQHCTGHITMGSWEGRGNQYIQLVLYCKLQTNGKQLPAFKLEVRLGTETRSQRWKARVLPLCHCGSLCVIIV